MRGGFVLGLLFYLATGPAVAQPAYTPESLAASYAKGWRPLQPPPEYRKPYTGVLTVIGVPLDEIPAKCKQVPKVLGCAYWGKDLSWCKIYLPLAVGEKIRDAIYEHELGHCHGWVHGYPGKAAVDAEITRGKEVADKLIQTGVERLQSRGCQAQITLFGKPENCP